MTTTTSTPSRTAIRRLAVARIISITGGAAAYVALQFTIYERTGSSTWVAASLFATFGVAGFLMPFGGWLGDRFDRKKVMIASDLAGAAAFAGMAMVDAPWLLLVFAFLSAAAEAPFWASSAAAIPNLVEDEKDLGWANGLVNIGRQAGIFVGPMLGGIAAVSADAIFLTNAVSFVVSALIIASVHGRFAAERSKAKRERSGLLDGVRFILHDPILLRISLAWQGIVLGLGMAMVADVAIAESFGMGRFGFGVIIAAWGGGSVVGSYMGRWLNARNEPAVLMYACFAVGVTAIGVGLSPWFVMVVVVILAMGVADGLNFVAQQSVMQRRTPDEVRSRAAGAFDALVHIGLGVSYLVAGPAVDFFGPQGVYTVGGVVTLFAALILVPVYLASRRAPLDAGTPSGPDEDVAVTAGGGEPVLG